MRDAWAVVRVSDNGTGIASDRKSRIFDLFVHDARAADRSEGGLGIGLALVRHLVECTAARWPQPQPRPQSGRGDPRGWPH